MATSSVGSHLEKSIVKVCKGGGYYSPNGVPPAIPVLLNFSVATDPDPAGRYLQPFVDFNIPKTAYNNYKTKFSSVS